jgi:hypothetical protein
MAGNIGFASRVAQGRISVFEVMEARIHGTLGQSHHHGDLFVRGLDGNGPDLLPHRFQPTPVTAYDPLPFLAFLGIELVLEPILVETEAGVNLVAEANMAFAPPKAVFGEFLERIDSGAQVLLPPCP